MKDLNVHSLDNLLFRMHIYTHDEFTYILRRMLRFLAFLRVNFGPMNILSLMYYI